MRRVRVRSDHPVHVTLRLGAGLPSLRERPAWAQIVRGLRAIRNKQKTFRVVHYSVMTNHIHLIVEADGADSFSRGMRALTTSFAMRLNRLFGRKGRLFDDRYDARALAKPRAVRNALAYVLLNLRKHAAANGEPVGTGAIDQRSSGATFDGWLHPPACREVDADFGTSPAQTWSLQTGWRYWGLIDVDEVPGPRARRAAPRKRLAV